MFSFFSSKPTKDKFARAVQKELVKAGVAGPFEYRKEDFSLRQGDQIFYMGNMFDLYAAAEKGQRGQIMENIVSIFTRKEEKVDREEALATVVAVVRERALFSFASLLWKLEDFIK